MSVTCGRSVVFSIQHYVIKFVSDLRQVGGLLYTTLCDKVCQWLATGQWFSLGVLVSYTNKTDLRDISEILLIVALGTITLTLDNIFLLNFLSISNSIWKRSKPLSCIYEKTYRSYKFSPTILREDILIYWLFYSIFFTSYIYFNSYSIFL